MAKYNLKEFKSIAEAVKTGNLRKMNSALEEHESFFLTCGVYLILEKLKLIVYRSLFKRICHILKTHLLPIEVFTASLHLMGVSYKLVCFIICC
ncbi:unnamed protein product [Trichobilharzia regenti]|nr:unnamed protein product [Trichobilharzia regenti]